MVVCSDTMGVNDGMNYLIASVAIVGIVAWADAGSSSQNVNGLVVSKDGKPVVGADVSTLWYVEMPGKMKPVRPLKTDAEGRFTLECDNVDRDVAVLAIDAAGEVGGFAILNIKTSERLLRIEVGPLIEIKGHFTCNESGEIPTHTGVMIRLSPSDQLIATIRSPGANFVAKLPPGHYRLGGNGKASDYVGVEQEATLSPWKALDVGAIDLKLTAIARHYGKQPPALHVTDARGVKQAFQLIDLRGKWVVIDFWAFGVAPVLVGAFQGGSIFVRITLPTVTPLRFWRFTILKQRVLRC